MFLETLENTVQNYLKMKQFYTILLKKVKTRSFLENHDMDVP